MLERGTCQRDHIPDFLFILALEILFHIIKSKPEIKGLTIFDHCYLYSTYGCLILFIYLFICLFLYFFGLKPNSTKSEIKSIGVLKGVQVAVCSMHFIDLNNKLKILGTHFSYKRKLKEEKIFVRL